MHLDAEMRGFLLIQDQLNRLIEFRDREHRPSGERDPVNLLRGALVADPGGPLELGHLKFQIVDFALALLRLGLDADLEAIERLLDDVGLLLLVGHACALRAANLASWSRSVSTVSMNATTAIITNSPIDSPLARAAA